MCRTDGGVPACPEGKGWGEESAAKIVQARAALVGRGDKGSHGEGSKVTVGSQTWVVERLTGLLARRGGIMEEGKQG